MAEDGLLAKNGRATREHESHARPPPRLEGDSAGLSARDARA